MFSETTKTLIELALQEDIGTGDTTTQALIPGEVKAAVKIIAREDLVVCGQKVASAVFSRLNPLIFYTALVEDGTKIRRDDVLAELEGPFAPILSAERVALNFLQRLSGIATATARIAKKLKPSGVRVLDTRKTTPGWRELEKYAVRVGGGVNHRLGLFDAVLIKNNHLDALHGDIIGAIEQCRKNVSSKVKVQVEVRDLGELEAALKAKPDSILFDNMSPAQLKEAIGVARASTVGTTIALEASGGISENNILEYALEGLDFISLGMLTHSVKAADISLRYLRREAS